MSAIPVHRYGDLLAAGSSRRRIFAALKAETLVWVRPGFYADGKTWTASKPEERIIARAEALSRASTAMPIVSHETAAARHGLPLFRAREDKVHVIAPAKRPGSASSVIRHRGELGADDTVEIDGMTCTSLARTVADVARTANFEQSVVVADAALRRIAVPSAGEYLIDVAEEFRENVRKIIRRSAHGQTRAMRALAFADGRAQLPGESISRIRLVALGFRLIELQVHVAGPAETNYYIDFGLRDERAFGEFDGAMKYEDGRLTDGRTTAEIFDREKQREDWIRGRTHWRYVRWGWPHIASAQTLSARLDAFGIRPSA